jgi:hypothetical protein
MIFGIFAADLLQIRRVFFEICALILAKKQYIMVYVRD